MSTSGVVLSVDVEKYGATLTAATLATDVVLQVDDIVDFADEDDFADGPQWLTVGESAPMQYVSVDDDNDTVTLAVAAGVAYEAGEPVRMWDAAADAEVVGYVAQVELDEADGDDQPIPAEITHDRMIFFGLDSMAGLIGARVSLEEDEDDPEAWVVAEVAGRAPAVAGDYVAGALTVDSLTVAQRPAESLSETFSGTSLPAGWVSTKTGVSGSGSGSASVPGVSVVSSGPVGMSGSALLVDFGAAGLSSPAGDAAGEVLAPLDATSDAEVMVRFKSNLNSDGLLLTPERAYINIRRQDGAAWSSTEDSIRLSLLGNYDGFAATWAFAVESVTNGSAAQLGAAVLAVDPSTAWHWAKLRVSSGAVSAKVWRDGTAEPAWMFSAQQSGVLTSGAVSLTWQQSTFLSNSRGMDLHVDQWTAQTYETGLSVNPDGSGDWPHLRALLSGSSQSGTVSSGAFSAVDTAKDVAVTFPTPFAAPPRVACQIVTTHSPVNFYPLTVKNVTASGFTVSAARRTATGAVDIHWSATVA